MNSQIMNKKLKILFADDGSAHAKAASMMISDLAKVAGNSIMVVAAYDPDEEIEYAAKIHLLELTKQAFLVNNIKVETRLVAGHPAERVVDVADEIHPNLIVMGAKGLRSTLGVLLGGTAQQVVEYADWPVLIVRSPYNGIKKVMLALDGSEQSRRALDFLCNTEGRFPFPDGIKIDIVHVLSPIDLPDIYLQSIHIGPEFLAQTQIEQAILRQKEEEKIGKELVLQAEGKLQEVGFDVKGKLLRGDAATELLDYIQKEKIDIVVAGSRGLSRVRSWLLGSVSRKLVHYSNCSALIVK